MVTGTLTLNANGKTFTASISTILFDIARVAVVENADKSADNHPDGTVMETPSALHRRFRTDSRA